MKTNVANLFRPEIQHLPIEDPSSDEAHQMASQWIDDFIQHHKMCGTPPGSGTHAAHACNTDLPKRVLEVKGASVYLREPASTKALCACLSHCWGVNGAALQLTSATLGRLRGGIRTQDLPKTFRDAVSICSKHSIRYI
jgi:hypothetical protein